MPSGGGLNARIGLSASHTGPVERAHASAHVNVRAIETATRARMSKEILYGEDAQDVLRSLRNRQARHFMKDVAARAVPLHDLRVDVDGLGKRLIALRVG